MNTVTFEVASPIRRSARVQQVSAMFDVPPADTSHRTWELDLPLDEKPWVIGCVLGPSGSGKTTLARHLWPRQMNNTPAWKPHALIDSFPPHMTTSDIAALLCGVGLSSPPAWLRPRHTLSNGEGFRAEVALRLALTPTGETAVFDEWTSVVDRHVARIASHTTQKTIRKTGCRLVAVTCHYDVTDWLQPDWTLDMATGTFAWRSVQPRPRIPLEISPVHRSVWPVFARHHYLSGVLKPGSTCLGAFNQAGDCIAFLAHTHFPHPKTRNIRMVHRLVCLPDWQGVGIGPCMITWLGQHLHHQETRLRIASAHPSVISACTRSPRWQETRRARRHLKVAGKNSSMSDNRYYFNPRAFNVRSFEYTAPRPVMEN